MAKCIECNDEFEPYKPHEWEDYVQNELCPECYEDAKREDDLWFDEWDRDAHGAN